MARPASAQPTELELLILKILWRQSPLPVRDVRQALAAQGRELAHTSVITTLNTMVEKQYIKRSMRGNACLFAPRVSYEHISRRMLGDVVDRVFDGSAKSLLLSLFDSTELDENELKELRQLINRKARKKP